MYYHIIFFLFQGRFFVLLERVFVFLKFMKAIGAIIERRVLRSSYLLIHFSPQRVFIIYIFSQRTAE